MIDCLLIGHNDGEFAALVASIKPMGIDHPDFRDLKLNYIEYDQKPYRALDILDKFYYEKRRDNYRRFHNADLLWNTLMYLGSYLSKRNMTFDYINLFHLEREKLKKKLKKNKYLAIAVTTTIYTMIDPILEVISFIKKYNNEAKIIVGGPFIAKHVEAMDVDSKKQFFQLIGADFFVYSREGEKALYNIIHTLKNRGEFGKIKNIALRNDSGYEITEPELEDNPLNENVIDYSLFAKEDIGDTVNVRTSKGCPYACSYCGFPLRAEKYRFLNTTEIIRDLDAINSMGMVKNLFFMDDTINVPKSRFKELMKAMAERDYGFSWNCFLRCDLCDEEMIALMKAAKCEGVFLGLESVDEQVLKNMNKTSRKIHFEESIPLFKKHGITVFVSIFTGFPGETYETFWETIDFIQEMKVDFYRPQLWYCDPVTPIWRQKEQYGLEGANFVWSHHTMDSKTACDLNEWAMLYLDDPVWAPDPGFNFISVYYLKHRGMKINVQKTFLRCFNAIVKERLIYPNQKNVSSDLIQALKKSARFLDGEKLDLRVVNRYSGKEYRNTEKFLLKEFYRQEEAEKIGRFRYVALTEEKKELKQQTGIADLKRSVIDKFLEKYGMDAFYMVLAACSGGVSKIVGQDDLKILVGAEDFSLIPIRVKVPERIGYDELANSIKQRIDVTLPYQLFALHVLANSKEYNDGMLEFDLAFLSVNNGNEDERLEKYHVGIYNRLGLIVKLVDFRAHRQLRIEYSPQRYTQDFIEKFCAEVTDLLEQFCESPEFFYEGITFRRRNDQIKEYANSLFKF